ncbi:hypothetical protein J7337_008074 [Fusarium musae]|uniref:Uncharacterized protein n=1 Tax=Fusarium musae TaxID=1042133 RepID=A0A9P8DD32_9HYPO|nr:hypothetical protein J7337_008074 [Fusarium musae]KAG9499616.1 hypothetical protein J7337_008074 [Fusarium musae]
MDFMAEARRNETEQEAPAALLAHILVNICAAIPLTEEYVTDERTLSSRVSRLLSIDADLKDWAQMLPAEYEYETRTKPSDLGGAEVFMERHDVYCSAEIANFRNYHT